MRLVTFVRVIPPAPEIYRRNLTIIYHVCAQIRPSIYISDFEHRKSDTQLCFDIYQSIVFCNSLTTTCTTGFQVTRPKSKCQIGYEIISGVT